MYVPAFELHEATDLAQALALMTRYGPRTRLLAGGTDLLVDLKTGRISVQHVVSLNRVSELRGVSTDDHGLRIAALTTPNQLTADPIVRRRFTPLLDAAGEMAAPQIRNMATVGGNIASAIPSADLPPILIVMNASVVLRSECGERTVPLTSFFVGPRRSVRRDSEVLTAVVVPYPPAGSGAGYARFALREANACAVAGVAASLQLDADRTIRHARIALGAVAPTPTLAASASEVLVGETADEDVFRRAGVAAMEAADPISDVRGSREYRRELVGVLTRRALSIASRRAMDSKV